MIPLKTAIADDDRYICQQIQECLMQYSTQKDIDIDDPDIYTDCATLYNTDFTQKRYDLVFMDIDFSGGTEPVKHFSLFDTTRERCDNGIALGAHLRNRLGHNYFDIIYVTSFENYAIHTIPNRPAALVQKPVTYGEDLKRTGRCTLLSGHLMACIRIYLQQLAGTRPGLKDPVSEQLRQKDLSANQ